GVRVDNAVFWSGGEGGGVVLAKLRRFPVLSYLCHIVRGASAIRMRVQSLADSRLRFGWQCDRDARALKTKSRHTAKCDGFSRSDEYAPIDLSRLPLSLVNKPCHCFDKRRRHRK